MTRHTIVGRPFAHRDRPTHRASRYSFDSIPHAVHGRVMNLGQWNNRSPAKLRVASEIYSDAAADTLQ